MLSLPSFFHAFRARVVILSFLLSSLVLFQLPYLEAAGWGVAKKIVEYEGTAWNEVYVDLDGLYFTASVPNYSGAIMVNDDISMGGKLDGYVYDIFTTWNPTFAAPKSIEKFVEIVQNDNPGYIIVLLDEKKFNSKYAIDLIPKDPENTYCARFLSTKDRLIQVCSSDINEHRRLFFFDSVHIQKKVK